ncbi:nuclear transport factor 2 family protein [Caulobacter sp. KR2-114]|uniref:nuclear transport factor 2 family protein n=1 Tax=Caulobacter sp. KR2-114 TaxID=3400912 RepID=UPI003C032A70
MDDVERLLIERACARLVARYCHLVDHGEAERVADLFTEDGTWSSPEQMMDGREAIARGFRRRQDNRGRISRHVCENLLVEVQDAERAAGVVYLTLYREDGPPGRPYATALVPALIGEYRDVFVRTPDGWRIRSRETVVSFRPG